MGITNNVIRDAVKSPMGLLNLRLCTQNARHTLAVIGVNSLRIQRERAEDKKAFDSSLKETAAKSPRGFYSWVVEQGALAAKGVLTTCGQHGAMMGASLESELVSEFHRIMEADKLFGGLEKTSTHDICGMTLSVYPGLDNNTLIGALCREHARRTDDVQELLEQNMATPAGEPSPVVLLEDNPSWATEKPDMRNIRGNMRAAVTEASASAQEISRLVNEKYGAGTMAKIKNVVVFGIGANDMYLKDLPKLLNSDPLSKRKLYSVFEPGQLRSFLLDVNADNTLYIAISRGGGTEETLKSMEFAKKCNMMQYLVAYANKGKVKEFAEACDGITFTLNPNIGGRYMWAKGNIVLVPLALCADEGAWTEYTDAMVEFDQTFWPVGRDKTILQLAQHLYMYSCAYNIPGFFACSNNPVLEAGLRQVFQLHNEAVGKIANGMFAFGAGMEMLPFAHAGADGLLGGAVSALSYGAFIFDTNLPKDMVELEAADLLKSEAGHAGLSVEKLRMACVFPNQAKFSFSGAPNFMVTMNGVTYRNLALMTAFYQSLMYPYLIMNNTNPDSNPNVAMVRATTSGLTSALLADRGRPPIDVITAETPKLMR